MRTRSLLAAAAALSVLLPASAGAATSLPVGEADGVRITDRGARSAIVFTKKADRLWTRIAGKPIEIECVRVRVSSPGLLDYEGDGYATRAPRRRAALRLGTTAGSDYCTVSLRYRHGRDLSFDEVVAIPLTQAGAVLLDERRKAAALMNVIGLAGVIGGAQQPAGFPTPEQLTSGEAARLLRRERLKVAALATADATPPAGSVGYWSDGAQRALVVTVSAAGRRLYIELGPDEELRTNVSRVLFGDL